MTEAPRPPLPDELPVVEIPLLGGVPAGPLTNIAELRFQAIDTVYVPRSVIGSSKRVFALVVKGCSMEPSIHDGDYVVVDADAPIVDGKVYVVKTNGESTCKRVYRDNGKLRLVGSNGVMELKGEEQVENVGRVIASGHLTML
jgi:repressor LexA